MVSKVVDGLTTTYDYDAVSQLTGESRSGYTATYTYDNNGNRSTRTVNSSTETYTYDSADKLTEITGGSNPRTFEYDAAGRTTEIESGAGTRYFVYDYESRLTSLTLENSAVHTYSYNGLDTRVGRNEAGTTRTYRRDGAYVTDPVLGDGNSNFTPGVSSRTGSTSSFFQADFLGSVTKQTGSGQTVTTSRQYDAFGNLTSGSSAAPFGFAGRWGYQEDASGYKLLGHRYYDSSTGRFLTRDPAKDGRNWYSYCGNNPLKAVDPDGLRLRITPAQMVHLAKAIADENWDYFFMIAETITGVEVPIAIQDLIKSVPRPKKVISNAGKHGKGYIRQILEHSKKVADEPDARSVPHWKKEIWVFMGNYYKKQGK